ncbi:MAG: TetR/AcrR family transcriptional regulator C-terminal ligand-binding domain-containing protein [Chloroflexota bacterium]
MESIDPRIERSKTKVLEAAADILANQGASAATIERIATQAGVARTTVYRHWDSLGKLLMDAFEMQASAAPETPQTSDLRKTLLSLLEELAWALTKSKRANMLPALIDAAERNSDVAALQSRHTEMRRKPIRDAIRRAVKQGELPSSIDIETALDQLSGPLFYRRLITHRPLTRDFLEKVLTGALTSWKTGS